MFFAFETSIDVRTAEESTPFSTFVSALPSVSSHSVPLNWFLSWPHASTMYSSIANFEKVDHIYYKRYTMTHADGGNNALDLAVRTNKDLTTEEYEHSGDSSLPPRTRHMTEAESSSWNNSSSGVLVVLVHGLAGGSHENYIRRSITAIFRQYPDDAQVSVVAFNARGCARSKVTSKEYWNAAKTEDLAAALTHLRRIYPNRKVMAIGFSLGANILCNHLAKSGKQSGISLAVSVSNPWNLLASNVNLESYWLGRLYTKRMAAGLQRLFNRHSPMLLLHDNIDKSLVMAARSLRDFDAAFTARAFGYESAEQYYAFASSSRIVHDIQTNTIIINAKDDPMALDAVLPYKQVSENKNLVMLATGHGGHIGWYGVQNQRWFVDVIVDALHGLVNGSV